MFRRPRRPLRPRPIRIPPPPMVHQQMLRNAFLGQDEDNPAELAKTFANLAEQAARNGHPLQAANLHVQAAHHWLDAGNAEKAQIQANLAVAAFTELGMEKRLQEFQTRFQMHKQHPGTTINTILEQETAMKSSPAKSLPPFCGQCGAPVRSDEIEWIDEHSAECGFCGSVIKTTTSG